MNRFEVIARDEEEGKPLLSILRKRYPLAPEHVFQSALKLRDIKINGERISHNVSLNAGNRVTWFTTWEEPELKIVYEDDNLMIINKPAGISTDRQADSAMSAEEWADSRGAFVVHRLDQQTSGLLILAKNKEKKLALEEAFRLRQIEKHYQCLVSGIPGKSHDILRAYLLKDSKSSIVTISDKPRRFAKQIVTEYDVLEAKGDSARLLVTLHTGRTHQIRAHMAFIGHPLLGDDKYGNYDINRKFKSKRLMLCSIGLRFHTAGVLAYMEGRTFSIEAPF